jgi:hypothetical protein
MATFAMTPPICRHTVRSSRWFPRLACFFAAIALPVACAKYRVLSRDGGNSDLGTDAADQSPADTADVEGHNVGDAVDAGRSLGLSCLSDGECASTHCSRDGVCCDTQCAGPCARCSSAGVCTMPADDPACGTIACPMDTPCRDWPTSIATNRCAAIGTCKTAMDCASINLPAGTFCGFYQQMSDKALVCDERGVCVAPTVTCGADGECPVNPGSCCFSRGGAGRTCNRDGQSCDATTSAPVLCDEAADCPPRYICCYTGNLGVVRTICATSCPPPSGPGTQVQICNPNTPAECLAGSCRTGPDTFAGPAFYCQ